MGWFKNRSGHEYSGRHGSSTCSNEERLENPASKAIIYRSEIDYISRCILDYPNIETGGQLFGYWTALGCKATRNLSLAVPWWTCHPDRAERRKDLLFCFAYLQVRRVPGFFTNVQNDKTTFCYRQVLQQQVKRSIAAGYAVWVAKSKTSQ